MINMPKKKKFRRGPGGRGVFHKGAFEEYDAVTKEDSKKNYDDNMKKLKEAKGQSTSARKLRHQLMDEQWKVRYDRLEFDDTYRAEVEHNEALLKAQANKDPDLLTSRCKWCKTMNLRVRRQHQIICSECGHRTIYHLNPIELISP